MILERLRLCNWGAHQLLAHGRPDVAMAFLGGLGDELLCSAPLEEWRRRGARNVWLMTTSPDLFQNEAAPARILPNDPRYPRLCDRLGIKFRYLSYSTYDAAADRDSAQPRHLIAEMCHRAGVSGPIQLRPYWRISPTERTTAEPWREYIAIQTCTLTAHVPMANKQWPVTRFQDVVDRLSPWHKFVQIGSSSDPRLRGVADLCGKTSLRETAAILHHSRLFIGLVGFLMHLARAVDCPAVIVYGGRETPAVTGYPCNINLTSQAPCAPCWQRNRCDFDRFCMESIQSIEVGDAVETLLTRPRDLMLESTFEL